MYSNFDMHYIQKDIILSLALQSPQRFSELQPARIPNNTFSYHLKRLVDNDYIVHENGVYAITRKALKTVQFDPRIKPSETPALMTIIYVTRDDGEVLVHKRTQQPFVDYYGLPSGLVRKGDDLADAAKKALKETTGINPTEPLTYAGTLDFQYLQKKSKDIFVHSVAIIFTYEYGNRPLPAAPPNSGRPGWSGLTREKILPEVRAVHDLIKTKKTFVSVLFDEPE